MKPAFVRFRGILIILALLLPISAYATNGYFLIGYGAKSRGMGGTGVAHGTDGLAAAANPASMTDVDIDTMRVDAGIEYFRPKRAVVQDSAALESGFPGSDSLEDSTFCSSWPWEGYRHGSWFQTLPTPRKFGVLSGHCSFRSTIWQCFSTCCPP